jgi:hypothetical protein
MVLYDGGALHYWMIDSCVYVQYKGREDVFYTSPAVWPPRIKHHWELWAKPAAERDIHSLNNHYIYRQ